jgi:hypothetical protein
MRWYRARKSIIIIILNSNKASDRSDSCSGRFAPEKIEYEAERAPQPE